MRHGNQTDIFLADPGHKVFIVWAGSVGSMVCYTLAQMWFTNIAVCDFDEVEDHNIAQQFYKEADCGVQKVVALQENIKAFTWTDIFVHDGAYDPAMTEGYDIVILAVDSMEVRKQVVETAEPTIWFVDARMAGEYFEIYTFHNDWVGTDLWEDTWYSDDEADHEKCTAKGIAYNTHIIAGIVAKNTTSLFEDNLVPFKVAFDLKNLIMET